MSNQQISSALSGFDQHGKDIFNSSKDMMINADKGDDNFSDNAMAVGGGDGFHPSGEVVTNASYEVHCSDIVKKQNH